MVNERVVLAGEADRRADQRETVNDGSAVLAAVRRKLLDEWARAVAAGATGDLHRRMLRAVERSDALLAIGWRCRSQAMALCHQAEETRRAVATERHQSGAALAALLAAGNEFTQVLDELPAGRTSPRRGGPVERNV